MLPGPARPGRADLADLAEAAEWAAGVASGTLLAVTGLIVFLAAALVVPPAAAGPPPAAPPASVPPAAAQLAVPGMERGRSPEASIRWRRSRAIGRPNQGRLAGGVELPAAGTHFVTLDPVTRTSPNRAWRRYGTDRLLEVVLSVAAAHAAAHPGAPRLVVGDLSRPRGGRFGREYGGDGHRSHQNGLDADVYYPRRDGLERAPARVTQIDRRLAQELVDRFVRAGAEYVFVGPGTGLRGPDKVVMTLGNHDDHLHVRIRAGRRR
jgi:Penicillin-insensitive murein endopeptidase